MVKKWMPVLSTLIVVIFAFIGAQAQEPIISLEIRAGLHDGIGEVNSAALWEDGVLLGSSTGIHFFLNQDEEPTTISLPINEVSGEAAPLTSILIQDDQAYALSLPHGKLWTLQWDEQSLSLAPSTSFQTDIFFDETSQRIWVPQQVLLSGDNLCVLSRNEQSLGGSVLVLVNLHDGSTRMFPQTSGQSFTHLTNYLPGQLLALTHGRGAARAIAINLADFTQTPFAQLDNIRPGNTSILYQPMEDALYIHQGGRLLRRSIDGKINEVGFLNVDPGYFIRFGRLAWNGFRQVTVAHAHGLFVGDAFANNTEPMVILGMDERDPAHIHAMRNMGNIGMRLQQVEAGQTADKLAEVLVGGLNQPDIFMVYSDEVDLPGLMRKGYVMNLSDHGDFMAFARSTYPDIQAQCTLNGELLWLPIRVSYDGISVNQAAFAKMGIDMPATITDLRELMEAWPVIAEQWDEIAFLSYGTPKGMLIDVLWRTWLADSSARGKAIDLEDPKFAALLHSVDAAALRDWPNMQKNEDTSYLFPQSLAESFDLQNWTAYFNMVRDGVSALSFASFPHPMRVDEAGTPVLPVRVAYLGINPRSDQPEAALLYLKNYLKALPAQQRILLCPDNNEPVSNPQLDVAIQNAQQTLDTAKALLENAAPDADKYTLANRVANAQRLLSHWQSDPPLISEKAITTYRNLMKQAVVMTYQNTSGAAQVNMEALIARFRMGHISVEDFISEGTRILRFIEMENR